MVSSKYILNALLLACIALTPYVSAGVFSPGSLQDDDSLCPYMGHQLCSSITFKGAIAKGDAEDLQGYLSRLNEMGVRVGHVWFDSPGGDLDEAMKIGRILRENKIQGLLAENDKCYSACVLMLAGTVARLPMGQVGVHSFYSLESTTKGFDYDQQEQRFRVMAAKIEEYLREMRVPDTLLGDMMDVPFNKIKILSWEELRERRLFAHDPLFHQYLTAHDYLNKRREK